MTPASRKTPAPRTRVVLVVDDDNDILESLVDLLTAQVPNLRCLVATSGAQALPLLERERVDLIVSDYKMPGMDGVEFLKQARARAPRVPRILLTAFADLAIAIQAINEAGVEMFFTKPLDPDRVVAVVRDSLASRRAREDRDQAIGRALGLRGKGSA
jgi:DNA-binding NtrC family response regulator